MSTKTEKEKTGERKIPASELIRKFIPFYRPYMKVFIFDMLCVLAIVGVDLAFPILVRNIMQQGLNTQTGVMLQMIIKTGLMILALKLLSSGCNFYVAYFGHTMGTGMETNIRSKMFTHLQQMPFKYYDDIKIGQLMSRMTNDLFDITELAHHGPEMILQAAIKVVGAFVILANINLLLTCLIFIMLPVMLVFTAKLNVRMKRAFKDNRKKIAIINEQIEDSLAGIRVVKSFANEEIELDKFEDGNKQYYSAKKDSYKYMGIFSGGINLFNGFMYVMVIVAGSLFASYGYIEIVDVVAYLLYVETLLGSISMIIQFTEQFQRGMTGFERFIEIVEMVPEIKDAPEAVSIDKAGAVKGKVEFEHVEFAYGEELEDVLTDINLKVMPGEDVAFVGPSGAGKTTICALIPRFYDVTGGAIKIDGQNIKDVTLKSLRENIGVVQQDVYMFGGTIGENILYGRPDATHEEVVQAAKQANAHEFILDLPKGYDTYVGERGVKLSGGQKQRISIARVFLKNPPILILDEATSSLDNESENIVQESLEVLAKGRTTFTIAHRLSTVRNASRIMVLTEKGIEESGTHEELIAMKGIYAHLHDA